LVVNWAFCFDPLSTVMLIVVSGVSSLVHLYSTEYMNGDPHQGRFMSYLSLFTAFMLVLVTADNFVLMFFG
jgi:NADH-quinone oxidoreductase subunit L